MTLIDLILKLVLQFVPMETNEFAKLKNEAEMWWASIIAPKSNSKEDIEKFKEEFPSKANDMKLPMIKYWFSMWYMRLFFAVMYIVGYREITKYMNPKQDEVKQDAH